MKIMVSACLLGQNCKYDGSFSGKLIEGKGIFAELSAENGIKTIDLSELLEG